MLTTTTSEKNVKQNRKQTKKVSLPIENKWITVGFEIGRQNTYVRHVQLRFRAISRPINDVSSPEMTWKWFFFPRFFKKYPHDNIDIRNGTNGAPTDRP